MAALQKENESDYRKRNTEKPEEKERDPALFGRGGCLSIFHKSLLFAQAPKGLIICFILRMGYAKERNLYATHWLQVS